MAQKGKILGQSEKLNLESENNRVPRPSSQLRTSSLSLTLDLQDITKKFNNQIFNLTENSERQGITNKHSESRPYENYQIISNPCYSHSSRYTKTPITEKSQKSLQNNSNNKSEISKISPQDQQLTQRNIFCEDKKRKKKNKHFIKFDEIQQQNITNDYKEGHSKQYIENKYRVSWSTVTIILNTNNEILQQRKQKIQEQQDIEFKQQLENNGKTKEDIKKIFKNRIQQRQYRKKKEMSQK